MPKTDIDYSNTIIYKISCKDIANTDVYVGHTTNFVQRKHTHKQNCINPKSINYTLKLYEVIRENGGWSNWNMEIINFFECKDHYEARQKEQEYFILLNATLNSNELLPKENAKEKTKTKTKQNQKEKEKVQLNEKIIKEIFRCDTCNKNYNSSKLLENHNKTNKHLKKIEDTIISQENPMQLFSCQYCQVECSKQKDWDRHLLTRKHKKNIDNNAELDISHQMFTCKCGKKYSNNSGLWKHSKKCNINNINIEITEITEQQIIDKELDLKQLILEIFKNNNEMQKQQFELQKQTNELQKQMIDVCKNTTITNMNINNSNNSHNKTFNLQFFLNEQCKDAMNLSDFANSFDLQLSDLETVGELGYVDGITKIMVDKLNAMDIYKRPIHCSDAKREIIYVKDENVWTKEEKDNPKLRQAIKNVSFRNMKLVYNWSNAYPESKDNESRLNDKYMKLVIESTGGKGPIMESENKIIRRIVKEIIIGKNLNN
jgi:hypothetical protein